MSWRAVLGCACAVLALAAAPAAARVVQAGSVLPPGQSGFVSIAGLADGSGSPHLNDQTDLFVHFGFKPDQFDPAATSTDTPRPGVTITRDAYGVPDVHGTTIGDTWWGAGYAIAQDRLFQLEIFRRAAEGRLSEVLGKSYLPMDEQTRRDFYTPAELDQQLNRMPPDIRQSFFDYRDGVNAWIAQARNDPNKLPGEFVALGVGPPQDWTLEDSVAVGVYLARTIPSNSGLEMDNLRAFQAIGPKAFDSILPLHTKNPVITVPRSSGRFPSDPGRTRKQERTAWKRSQAFARTLPLPSPQDDGSLAAASRRLPLIGHLGLPEGSDVWAIRGPNHRASLFTGPQLDYSIPELLVELEVHGPGLDARGVTAAGVPILGIGHNAHVAWGLTSGESDDDDLYAEKLVGSDGEHYMFKGRVLQMDCRNESFSYRPPPTAATSLPSLLGQITSGGGAGSQTERICRTVHGPVVARAGNVAYTRKFAIWGREADTIVGLNMLDRARNIRDVNTAMAKVTWNENCTAADDQGHIGYWHPGLLPWKPKLWDERLPYPGDGSAEWKGFLPLKARPHAIDPRQGYLFNWNNKPSADWTEGDVVSRLREEGPFHHSGYLGGLVRQVAKGPFGYAQTASVDRLSGTVSQQRSPATALVTRAARGASGPAAAVLGTILRWNGSYDTADASNTIDPGAAAWKALEVAAMNRTLGRYGDAGKLLGAVPSEDFDATLGEVYGLTHLGRAGLRAAAVDAFNTLSARFHSGDPAAWREPRPMKTPTSMGAGNFPPFPLFDRGTWQQVVELGP